MCVCVCVCVFVCLLVCSFVRLSVRPSVSLSVGPSVRPTVCLSVWLPVDLSVYLSVYLSVCLSISTVCLYVSTYIYPQIRMLSEPQCLRASMHTICEHATRIKDFSTLVMDSLKSPQKLLMSPQKCFCCCELLRQEFTCIVDPLATQNISRFNLTAGNSSSEPGAVLSAARQLDAYCACVFARSS